MKQLLLICLLALPMLANANDYLVHYERIVLSDAPCEGERDYFKAAKNDSHGFIERGCWIQRNGFIVLKFNGQMEQYPVESFEQVEEGDL